MLLIDISKYQVVASWALSLFVWHPPTLYLMITSKSFIHTKPLRTQRRYENAFTQKYTHTFMDIKYTAIRNWWIYLRLCATLDKILGHHTSNSVWDTNWALLWPAVVGSLMISPAWLKQCNGFHWGQGFLNYLLSWWSTWVRVRDLQARPAMNWTATINCSTPRFINFSIFFFLSFHRTHFSSFRSYILLHMAQRWCGSRGF